MSEVKGFKVFKPNWTCRGFQYEVGKIFGLGYSGKITFTLKKISV